MTFARPGIGHERWQRLVLAVVALLGVSRVAHAGAPEGLVGGVFRVTESTSARWPWSGAWRYPVGDARDYTEAGPAREPGYRLLRTVGGPDEGTKLHQGADLGCGHGGGIVRAAASGIVIKADRSGWNGGYGLCVVMAHRLPGGRLAYTVYAHLAPGSIVVRPGQIVAAGARVGRVGRTGRATTSHLHFEVRMAGAGDQPWEREDVVDPLEFVAARLPVPAPPDTIGRYIEWAQYAGLIESTPAEDTPLTPAGWWRMLAFASRLDLSSLPTAPAALADSLVAAGMLPDSPPPSTQHAMEWKDVARDLARIREEGLRLPVRPLENPGHRSACRSVLGDREPAHAMDKTLAKRAGHPTVLEAILVVSDLAPVLEKPKPRPARRRSASAAKPRAAAGDTTKTSRKP